MISCSGAFPLRTPCQYAFVITSLRECDYVTWRGCAFVAVRVCHCVLRVCAYIKVCVCDYVALRGCAFVTVRVCDCVALRVYAYVARLRLPYGKCLQLLPCVLAVPIRTRLIFRYGARLHNVMMLVSRPLHVSCCIAMSWWSFAVLSVLCS